MRLLHAELLKVWTAPRTTAALVLALLLIAALGSAGVSDGAANGFVEDPAGDVVDVAGTASIFALLLGILVVTWDYRHGTITPTVLVAPRRERVVAAKLSVAATLGAALALVALGIAILVAQLWIGDRLRFEDEHWSQMARVVAASMLWGVLGFGLGATLQSQVGALVTALVWFLVAELILIGLASLVADVGDYLPGEALRHFAGSGEDPGERFSRAAAGLIAAGYAVAAAAAGAAAMVRRDIG